MTTCYLQIPEEYPIKNPDIYMYRRRRAKNVLLQSFLSLSLHHIVVFDLFASIERSFYNSNVLLLWHTYPCVHECFDANSMTEKLPIVLILPQAYLTSAMHFGVMDCVLFCFARRPEPFSSQVTRHLSVPTPLHSSSSSSRWFPNPNHFVSTFILHDATDADIH